MARHAEPSKPRAVPETAAQLCGYCADGTCRSCARRRRHAWKLVTVEGLSVEDAAGRMGLTAGRVRVLVGQEEERRDLQQYRANQIPVERVRSLVEREMALDPQFTRAHLAHYLRVHQIDVDRQLGYTTGPGGRTQRYMSLQAASRVAIALGHAPREVDGP